MLYHGEVIWHNHRRVGTVRSGSYGHTLDGAIGLAMIDLNTPQYQFNDDVTSSKGKCDNNTNASSNNASSNTNTNNASTEATVISTSPESDSNHINNTATPPLQVINQEYIQSGLWEVEVGNTRYPILLSLSPLYDPLNIRIKV